MIKSTLNLSFIFLLTIILILALIITNKEFARSESLGSISTRVSRVESENARLRNRVNRLESQLRSLRPSTSKPDNIEPLYQPPAPSIQDPMFDRLATLVIELKERITAIEKHLNLGDFQEKMYQQ